MKRMIALIAVGVLSLAAVTPALADGIIIIDPPPVPPPDFSRWLTIRYHHVHVAIDDQVAVTEVDQVFRNDASVPVEGTYIFPLPPGAVVEDFRMWVDDAVMEAEILPADEARAIYESYVRRHRDPALLEYAGRDAVRARIFPIPAKGERRIRLQYSQVLPSEDDLMHYRYPLDTERFSARPLEQVSIVVEVKAPVDLGALYSPTHQSEVAITREDSHSATVSYEASDVLPDRDFELYIGACTEELGANLLSYKPRSEDGFFMLLISPSLAEEDTETVPRDLILILDTSGSMEGDKLDQAKGGLSYVLRHLNPKDRFNVVAFSTQTRTYAPALVPAADAEDAAAWIDGLEALGGTNIYMAFSEALLQVESERHTTVVFLTDGLPTEGIVDEDVLLNAVEKEAPEDVRIFPLGVGYDVNVLLLDQLAADHRGRPTYIEPDERIDEKVSAFFARMQSPLLTDIRLDFTENGRDNASGDSIEIFDIYPDPLPDLYAGTQLIVAGRYAGGGRQTLTLSGQVNGQRTTLVYGVSFAEHDGAAFVPRLWAARKIGYLLTQIRIHGEREEWIDAVVDLSLRYGIITPYTSFLIEEPELSLTREGRKRAGEAMQDELSAMPPTASGAEAVEDAKLRQDLGAAEAPVGGGTYVPEASAGEVLTVRHVDDKAFVCTPERCTDTTFVLDAMTAEVVAFGTARYRELVAANPALDRYYALAPETFVVDADGTAYHFVLGNLDDLPATSTPTPATATARAPTPTPAAPTGSDTPEPEVPLLPSGNRPGLCPGSLLLLAPLLIVAVERRLKRDQVCPPGQDSGSRRPSLH